MTNFSNQSLSNRSFAGENLAGANFRNADIRGCDFTNANLEGADFSGVRAGKSLRQQVILISCVIIETLVSIAVAMFAFGVLATFIFEKIFANVTAFNGLFAGCVAFGSGVLLCFLYLLFRLITKTHHKDLPMGQFILATFVGVGVISGKMGFGEFIKGNIFGGFFYFSLVLFCGWLIWFGIVLAVRTFQRATGTSFTQANLSYAQFIQSTLTGCNFSNSDLSNAKFYKANLRNSVLTNINADGTDFSGAILKEAYIQNWRINDNTKFDDVIWTRKAKTGWLDFSNQDLRNYSFKEDQNLVGANFRNADIRGCDFTNANLEGADFSGVKAGRSRTQEIILMAVVFGILIQGVFASAVAFKFVDASLIEFAGAVVGSFIFSLGITFTFWFVFSLAPIFDNVLSVLLFSPVMFVAMDGFAFAAIATFSEFTKGSFLWGIFIAVIALFLALVLYLIIFYGIILEFQKILGTSFSKTNLLDAQFSQSILSNCDFSNSDLTNATFHRAKLQNVNIANAKAHGTDFSRAKFKNINIQNWSIDANTNFNDAILSRELITSLLDSSNQDPINVQDGETDTVPNTELLDFSNQDLRNRSFKDNQNLAGANFRNADIRGCDFTNANLEGADFSGVKSGRSHRQKILLIAVALVVMIQGAFAAKIAFECSSASIIHLAVAVVGLLGLSLGIAFTFLFISTTVPETSSAILFSAVMFVAIDGFNFVAINTFNEFTKGNLIVGNLLAVITLLLGLVSCFFFAVLWMGFKELQKILGTSFSKTNLLDAQFSQSILSNCDFSNSDLTNATFHRAKLQNVNLANAKAHGTDFSRAKFKNINIQNWSIDADTNFNDAILSRELITALLDSSNQHPINVQDGETDTVPNTELLDFSNQDLRNRSFKDNQNLAGANFRNSDIRGCDFTNANLEGADFSGARAGRSRTQEIIFIMVVLIGVVQGFLGLKVLTFFYDFGGYILSILIMILGLLIGLFVNHSLITFLRSLSESLNKEFVNDTLLMSSLSGFFLGVDFILSPFCLFVLWMLIGDFQLKTGTFLNKANLSRTQFIEATLINCDFSSSDLNNATFYKATLRNSNFANANANGTDFSSAKLIGTNNENWNINADTNFNETIFIENISTIWLGFLVNFFKKANLLGLFLMGFSFACYIPLIVPFVNSNILLFLKLIIVVWLILSILISPLFSRFSDKGITKLRKKLRIPFIGLIFTTYIIYIIYRIYILFRGEHEHIGGTGSISFSSAGSLLGDIFWLPILSLALVIRKIRRNGRNLFISIIFTVSSFAFGIAVGYLIFVTSPNLILLGWITMPIGLLFLISSFPFEEH
jgi:uncharacterized protein YjbI with pentapeptide repeats